MARVEKTPAFPFYGKDAYDDERFSRLSFAEQGLYLYLAWWQWQEGTIPADLEDVLDKVPRRKVTESRRLWPAVSALFPIIEGATRRQDATVERRRAELITRRKKNQKGAVETNAKRWGVVSHSDSHSDDTTDSLCAATGGATAPATAPAEKPGGGSGGTRFGVVADSDAMDAIQQACQIFAPQIPQPDAAHLSAWLRDVNPDPWWIAAVICENEQSLQGARSLSYVDRILRNRQDEGYEIEDPRFYTEHRLRSKSRGAA